MANLTIAFLIAVNLYIIYRYFLLQRKLFRPQNVRSAMYEFFSIRDSLIMLVIKGEINENDEIYQGYYNNVNQVLASFKSVNRVSLADIISLSKKLTREDISQLNRYKNVTDNHKSEELKKIIRLYHMGIVNIILHNTTFYVMLKIGTVPLVKYFGSRIAKKIISYFFKDSYAFYREHKHALAVT